MEGIKNEELTSKKAKIKHRLKGKYPDIDVENEEVLYGKIDDDFDTEKLYEVIEKLANGEPLEEKYRDHYLSGDYKGCRECHIEPDWLLIYEIVDDILILMLYRVGSHSDLF